jgi:UDP-GlcNAc:undecaprenyl-phosphate GlcNAc-1-phosphate transferase
LSLILGVLTALIATTVLLPVASQVALRTGAIAQPRADRLSRRSVPTLGGIAIAGGILAGSALGLWGGADLAPLLLAVGGMALLGLADDLTTVGPLTRLGVQAATAVAFVLAVTPALEAPLRLAAALVASVAVPLAMNATNLVDNADGLAAALSAVTAVSLAGLGMVADVWGGPVAVGLATGAACLAFLLLRNRPPASMFMGDVGSLGLGFALAAATIFLVRDAIAAPSSGLIAAILFPVVWAVQLGDLALVYVTRRRRGASPFRGGVDHTSHRLLLLGLSPERMLVMLVVLAGCLGALVVLIAATQNLVLAAATVITIALVMVAFEIWLARRTEHHFRPGAIPLVSGATLAPASGSARASQPVGMSRAADKEA